MPTRPIELAAWMIESFRSAFPQLPNELPISVVPAQPEHGDYCCNAALGLASVLRKAPAQIAARVVAAAGRPEGVDDLQAVGGYINIRVTSAWLGAQVSAMATDPRLGVPAKGIGRRVVIDYGSPNVAKELHVGHIRSHFIGNALDRIYRFLGYDVVSDNHIGDWGKPFGLLLLGWKQDLDREALKLHPLRELERLYKKYSALSSKIDSVVDTAAREELVRLQSGDADKLAVWRQIVDATRRALDGIYDRLGIRFDHTLGESYYNSALPGMVEALTSRGVLTESEGAWCVLSDGSSPPAADPFMKHKKDAGWVPHPLIVRNSAGGFGYAATDLATLDYRVRTWQPECIVYVTDGRQQDHFRQVFAAFRRWQPDVKVELVHAWFGSILGPDGKPFASRGESVKLEPLLAEAVEGARAIVDAKRPDLALDERIAIAEDVGIGALKYADLLPNREIDYTYDKDRMLSLRGNTGIYLQYSVARTLRLAEKYCAGLTVVGADGAAILPVQPVERELALQLLQFPAAVDKAQLEHRPSILCGHLYDIAQAFNAFYQHVPVLDAEAGVRESRVQLSTLAGCTLRQGLDLLGINTPDRL
jgi:arginyl-tRNA synthetase